MNQPKDLPQLPPCFTWSNEHACRFWNEEGMYGYARAALAAATPSAPAVDAGARDNDSIMAALKAAGFHIEYTAAKAEYRVTGWLPNARQLFAALSASTEAATGEPMAWLWEHENYRTVTIAAPVAGALTDGMKATPLYTAPPAASGQTDAEFCEAYAQEWQDTLKEQSNRIKELEAQLTAASGQKLTFSIEGLRDKLLAPRAIQRDAAGWLTHPDYPICDEGTQADKFLEAFAIEPAFVSMEFDQPDFAERWHEEGLTDCSEWEPTPPAGDGWLLLEIYDTEDGPYALFGRDLYAAEQARKKENTRKLREAFKLDRASDSATASDKEA